MDASPTLVAAFRRRFPNAVVECAALEDSALFDRTFAGVVAVGVLFLLAPAAQASAIERIASVLDIGGRFLFTAPREAHVWSDVLTGRQSVSLGMAEYERLLRRAGLSFEGETFDEGGNHYYLARRTAAG